VIYFGNLIIQAKRDTRFIAFSTHWSNICYVWTTTTKFM